MMPTELHPRQLGLSDYLAILNRRKWVIVQTTLIVTVVAFVFSARQDKVFEAGAEVLLTRQNLSNVLTGVTSPDVYVAPERFAETQAGLASAPEVARRAIAQSGITTRTAGDLLASSSVRPRGNADLLHFTVEDGEPEIATRLANAYAEAFTEYKTDLDTAQLTQARKDLEQRAAELRRTGQTGTDLYRELVDSAQQLRTMELLQTPNLVVRPATGAGQIAPTPKRAALLGMFLGLLLGLGIAFLWEALDKRVRSEDEIERRLGLPLLSRLPEPPRRLEKEDRLTMIDDPQDAHAEAIRRLRTNLEFANVDGRAKVVMITSAVEREGKSTTIANLAVALARSGRNVALVDLDLRQPMIENYFGLQGRAGITDVVLERADLIATLFPAQLPVPVSASLSRNGSVGAVGRLNVLPAGALPANPGEFVGTQALVRALDQLRDGHDFVLLDSTPFLSVGDAMTLSARVDGIVVVTRLGVVQRRMLSDLSRELEASPAPKLGFVVTGADIKEGYSYGYAARRDESEPTDQPDMTTEQSDEAQSAARRAGRRATASG
jgi:succinoglycan biosynthesis transport protein ExoP